MPITRPVAVTLAGAALAVTAVTGGQHRDERVLQCGREVPGYGAPADRGVP